MGHNFDDFMKGGNYEKPHLFDEWEKLYSRCCERAESMILAGSTLRSLKVLVMVYSRFCGEAEK